MVRLENRKGLFKIVRVDGRRRVADVSQRVGKIDVIEQMVPAELIRQVPDGASKAIRAFLRSSSTHAGMGSGANPAIVESTHGLRGASAAEMRIVQG